MAEWEKIGKTRIKTEPSVIIPLSELELLQFSDRRENPKIQ
jgi:hypothetical protein